MTAEQIKASLLSAYADEVKAAENRNKLKRASEEEKAISALNERLKSAAASHKKALELSDAEKEQEKASAALYSELRGDRGGIGKLQYLSAFQNAALAKKTANEALSEERRSAAEEISKKRDERLFADAEGEEKAAEDIAAKQAELSKWAYEREQEEKASASALALKEAALTGEYKGEKTLGGQKSELSEETAAEKLLSSACYALLEKGVLPSDEQLAAAGITKEQAESYIKALLASGKIKSTGASSSSSAGGETIVLSSPGGLKSGSKSLGAY